VRQFFTVRFWLTIAALVGLAGLLWWVLPRDRDFAAVDAPDEDASLPVERDIDLIEPLFSAAGSADLVDGRTTGELQLVIDAARNVRIPPGTTGEITCATLDQVGTCAFAADLLGEAVLWFSVFPGDARGTLNLPAVRELRDQNQVLLANDWVVPRAEVVTRTCDQDTTSLGDFVRTFGDNAVAVWSVSAQRIIRVVCTPA
jgi:hypothetical protein